MLNSHSTFSQEETHCAVVLRNLKSASKKLKANILWKPQLLLFTLRIADKWLGGHGSWALAEIPKPFLT